MSELIDRNVLKAKMYQEAFESDTDMQKWDSGCWIRHKLFEKVVDSTPTVPYAPRWHRCEDELPEKEGDYLVWTMLYGGHAYTDYYTPKYGWDEYKVIAWMPLPEPPKEDA